jgi:nitrate reductase delta subunit
VRDDLVQDGLAPALDKMIHAFADRANPYRELLVAVRAVFAAPAAARPRGEEARP